MKLIAFLSLSLVTTSQAFQATTTPAKHQKVSPLFATAKDDARRGFLATGMAAAAFYWMIPTQRARAEGVDYKAVAADVMDLVKKNPDWGPSKKMILFDSTRVVTGRSLEFAQPLYVSRGILLVHTIRSPRREGLVEVRSASRKNWHTEAMLAWL